MREAASLLLLALLVFLAGCENPDLRNVTFKPLQEDPEAYKNAFRAYFVSDEEPAQPWGNEFLLRPAKTLGSSKAPLAGLPVTIDGNVSRTDRQGFLSLERLRPGYHSVEVELRSAPERRSRRHLSIPIEKGRMTLGIFQVSSGGRLTASLAVHPHGFLLTTPFRELAERHDRLQKLLDALEERNGAAGLEDSIDASFADRSGGKRDLLKARAFLRKTHRLPVLDIATATALVAPGQADVVLHCRLDGRPIVTRLNLSAAVPSEAPWRLASVTGLNPLMPLPPATADRP